MHILLLAYCNEDAVFRGLDLRDVISLAAPSDSQSNNQCRLRGIIFRLIFKKEMSASHKLLIVVN